MFTNNNTLSSTRLPTLQSSNVLPTSLPHVLPSSQDQTSPIFYTPSSSSSFYYAAPTFQQQDQYQNPYQIPPQALSSEEWDLILSFRRMKTLNILPSFQPSCSLVYQYPGSTALYQGASSSNQTGHQMQSFVCYATGATLAANSYHNTSSHIHSYTMSKTASQQMLDVQEIPCTTTPSSITSTTADSSSPLSTPTVPASLPYTTIDPSSAGSPTAVPLSPFDTTADSSSPSFTATVSPRSSYTTADPPSSYTTADPPSSYTTADPPSSYTTADPSLPSVSTQEASAQTHQSSQVQLHYQNNSPISPSHPRSPRSSSSSSVDTISPVQQRQQKQHQQDLANSCLPASSEQYQSFNHTTLTTYQYDLVVKQPTIQLLDPTKPYKIGDTIKVGGRILKSDTTSMKYWSEDDLIITGTTAGGHILNMAGYSYLLKNYGKNFTTWECERRRNHQCSTIVVRSSDPTAKHFRIFSIQGEHIHESAPDNVNIRKFKQHVRDRCRQELSSPRIIYEDELMKGKYSEEMLALLPTYYNMQAQLYRIRQDHLPTSPTDPNFVLHLGFTSTDKGGRFLLYDSMAVQAPYTSGSSKVGRLLIYSSDLQLTILSKSKRIGSDGTFDTAACISQQNYIIMAEFEEKHAVPIAFCLCEKKNYETYKLIIQVLKTAIDNLKLDFKPVYWMSDYEKALTKAIKEELPTTELLGCAFHYSKAIYRNIQVKGLQDTYQNDEVICQILRQIMALAFIPSDQIRIVYYGVIKPQLSNVPAKPTSLRYNLRDFFKYFESQWLKRINEFCVFDRSTRTNNELEGA
ncbi:unnamed protein product [Rotaria sordida]|uniref:MULE transposase domain-containing protein n=1 Tax=Rotaria sordida TaxID=392033 RepID=A0A815N134_9BILA|nr:unnamed protein product [Rotaria sordida]